MVFFWVKSLFFVLFFFFVYKRIKKCLLKICNVKAFFIVNSQLFVSAQCKYNTKKILNKTGNDLGWNLKMIW